MLVLSLIASLVWLGMMAWYVYCSQQKPVHFIIIGGVAIGGLGMMGLVLVPVIIQTVLLSLVGVLWAVRGWKPGSFLLASSAATAIAYGIVCGLAVLETNALRDEFPFV